MEHDQRVLIKMRCQRTPNDYGTAAAIDNVLNNFLANEHEDASKTDQYTASDGTYSVTMSIPVDTISEAGQIWARYNSAIDNFAPFVDSPTFVYKALGSLQTVDP